MALKTAAGGIAAGLALSMAGKAAVSAARWGAPVVTGVASQASQVSADTVRRALAWGNRAWDTVQNQTQNWFNGNQIKLYRVMSQAELDDLQRTGVFRGDPQGRSMDAKWFAERLQDAHTWGQQFYSGDNYRIVEITISRQIADQWMREPFLDGIGPARVAWPEEIVNFILRVVK